MKPDRDFRAFVTSFATPESVDDCTLMMYARPDHEDEDGCECNEPQLLDYSCGEIRCRTCGRRVG